MRNTNANDLSGVWRFIELFRGGCDMGTAVLCQKGNEVTGTFSYDELIDDGTSLVAVVDVRGYVSGQQVVLNGHRVVFSDFDGVYCLDNRIGLYADDNTIVGRAVDSQGVPGKFYLFRTQDGKRLPSSVRF